VTVETSEDLRRADPLPLAGVAAVRALGRWALTLLVVAVACEGTTRVDDWVRFRTPLTSPIAVEEDLLVRDGLGEHGRPGARYQKWILNNVGMRGPDVRIPKPDHTLRVVTAGASETFGLYESPGREYPRQLEDSLRAAMTRDGCTGVRAEVVNAAIFGMSLPSVDQDLRTRVAPLRPDVVVLYPTPVQYLADAVPRPAPLAPGVDDVEPWYGVLRPRALALAREQAKAMLPSWLMTWLRRRDIADAIAGEPPGWRFTSVPADRLAAYDRDLRHAIATVRAIGAVPIVMTHVNRFMAPGIRDSAELTTWGRFYPRATEQTVAAFDAAAVPVTVQAARESGAATVSLADAVRRQPPGTGARLFGDYAHFSDAGSALVAGALVPAIVQTAPARALCATTRPAVAAAAAAAATSAAPTGAGRQ